MTVLFASENAFERAENIGAVYDAYDGEKAFERGWESYRSGRYPVAVIDTMPPYMPDKSTTVVFVGHGLPCDKLYGFDQPAKYVDERVRGQIDYAVSPSSNPSVMSVIRGQTGAREVVPLGFARSDALVDADCTHDGRAYLYAPTFRGPNDGDRLPTIDWRKLDSLMADDERIVVKRHYFQREPITHGGFGHITEVEPERASTPYLIGCDVLVTDYSSIMFDAYVCGKPSVLTIDDMDEYMRKRGMYFDYPDWYGSRWLEADGNEVMLLEMMREAAANGITDVEARARDTVADMCDGHSCERIANFVKELA